MTEKSLKETRNLMGRTLFSFRPFQQCRLSTYICFIMFFLMAGCSSLHVNVSPAIDWNRVKVISFQSSPQDPWNLNQVIRSELTSLGFQIEDTQTNPDLLFRYKTQESPDLTDEGEVITRLNSLHLQFIDPATDALVTAVDYFYPAVSNPPAPETGVKEVFSGLRQQILTGNNSPSAAPAMLPSQTIPLTPAVVAPPTQSQETQAEQLQSAPIPTRIKPEKNVNDSQLKGGNAVATSLKTEPTALKKPDNNALQPSQQTRSPWLPKLKSWGFDNWGQDSTDDY